MKHSFRSIAHIAVALSVLSLAACSGTSALDQASLTVKAAIEKKLSAEDLERAGRAVSAKDITNETDDTTIHPAAVERDDPVWGDAAAPVTIIVYSDFQCPFCSRHADTVRKLKEDYGPLVRVVFKQFPLAFHKQARPAAMASLAAGDQGKFWPMHDKLFTKATLSEEEMHGWATDNGIDMGKILEAVRAGTHEGRVEADIAAGKKIGVTGTPCSFINGVKVSGAIQYERLEGYVELGMMRAYHLLNQGVPADKLYGKLTGTPTPKE